MGKLSSPSTELVRVITTPCTKHKVVNARCVVPQPEPARDLLLTMITKLVLCEDCSVDIVTERLSDGQVTILLSSSERQST